MSPCGEDLQWLFNELLAEYSKSRSGKRLHDSLATLDDIQRMMILRELFRTALSEDNWDLADACIEEGYRILPNPIDVSDFGPLHDAINELGDRPEVVEWLLGHGAFVDQRGLVNSTPLIMAARNGLLETLKVLLASGAGVNASTQIDDDETALMVAAKRGHTSAVEVLLGHGADTERKNRWGRDAAKLADEHGHEDIAWLIRRSTAPES